MAGFLRLESDGFAYVADRLAKFICFIPYGCSHLKARDTLWLEPNPFRNIGNRLINLVDVG